MNIAIGLGILWLSFGVVSFILLLVYDLIIESISDLILAFFLFVILLLYGIFGFVITVKVIIKEPKLHIFKHLRIFKKIKNSIILLSKIILKFLTKPRFNQNNK